VSAVKETVNKQPKKFLHSSAAKRYLPLVILFAVWVGVYALFAVLKPDSFPTFGTFETILRQTVIVGIAAVGMTFIIISGGIDLSVGSVIALVTVVIAWGLRAGWDPLWCVLFGVAIGTLAGLFNGILVTRLKIVPFIVTLGTMGILRGVAKGWSGEQKIEPGFKTWIGNIIAQDKGPLGMPAGVWILLALVLIAIWAQRNTVIGRHVVAIGSNEQAARLCGVRVERVKTWVYVFAGFCMGLAGLMLFGKLSVGDPTVAQGQELDVIAAVVIGGGSLSGGEGSILGSIIGALIMTTISSGCSQAGYPNWVQEIITASLIVIAVGLDRLRAARQS
jgi:ribose/xylose/arabinose/galactoside ABC-type transport system permease subunit